MPSNFQYSSFLLAHTCFNNWLASILILDALDTPYMAFGIVGSMQRGKSTPRCPYSNHTGTLQYLIHTEFQGAGVIQMFSKRLKAPAKYSLVETVE